MEKDRLIYTRPFKIRSIDVDADRKLRLSVLFSDFQEAAIAHTEALGMGREKTLDRGLLWIVTHQRAQISRLPGYDEEVVLRSWPGENMHLIFPRYFSVETAAGEPLIKASALWSLMDEKERKIVFPENHGVEIDGIITGNEIALPSPVKPLPCNESTEFCVPYSFVDLNGHMNNTRYPDILCSYSGNMNNKRVSSMCISYVSEAPLGEEIKIYRGYHDDVCYIRTIRPDGRVNVEAEINFTETKRAK